MNALQVVSPTVGKDADGADVSAAISEGCRVIMDTATRFTIHRQTVGHSRDEANPTWKPLLDTNDSKLIWKSINWKGVEDSDVQKPGDDQFKEHFEKLLNPPGLENLDNDEPENAPYIPILNDPFTTSELNLALCNTKMNKSYSGLCPGVVKHLPVLCLLFFT